MDDFEQFLKRQPARSLPPEWRAEILAAAGRDGGQISQINRKIGKAEDPPTIHDVPWWLAWLWPSPRAWAAVACAWLLIAGLETASVRSAGAVSSPALASAPGQKFQGIETILVALEKREEQFEKAARFQLESLESPREPEERERRGKPGACIRREQKIQVG